MNTPKKKFENIESTEEDLDDAPIANKRLPDEDDDDFEAPLDDLGGFDDLAPLDDDDDDDF
ncbi:MAG: hypothetical protein H7Y07_17560 [Pyrinomonadaceae bacterium]|nr:hypothetical protein [Sphingobacteriaceae bacterium]